MNQYVELAVALLPAAHDLLDLGVVLDVARLDEVGADGLRQRANASLDERFDRAEAELRASFVKRLGHPPRDRVVVGHAEDQRAPPVQEAHSHLLHAIACRSRVPPGAPIRP